MQCPVPIFYSFMEYFTVLQASSDRIQSLDKLQKPLRHEMIIPRQSCDTFLQREALDRKWNDNHAC